MSLISWNRFPNYDSKPLPCCLKLNSAIPSSNNSIKENDNPEIIFALPYIGNVGKQLLKHFLKKVIRFLNSNVKFRVLYNTKKISFCCKINSKVPYDQRNHVNCKIKCPCCNGCYISKTKMFNNQNYWEWHNRNIIFV